MELRSHSHATISFNEGGEVDEELPGGMKQFFGEYLAFPRLYC